MMKSENGNIFTAIAIFSVIPVLSILLISFSLPEKEIICDPEMVASGKVQEMPAAIIFPATEMPKSDDLCTIQSVRRHLAQELRYPQAAADAGHAGTVELYARVNRCGNINEVLEIQPSRDFTEIEKIVVTGKNTGDVEIVESSRHESLLSESRRVIMNLPRLDIPAVQGSIVKFTFRFVLQ